MQRECLMVSKNKDEEVNRLWIISCAYSQMHSTGLHLQSNMELQQDQTISFVTCSICCMCVLEYSAPFVYWWISNLGSYKWMALRSLQISDQCLLGANSARQETAQCSEHYLHSTEWYWQTKQQVHSMGTRLSITGGARHRWSRKE